MAADLGAAAPSLAVGASQLTGWKTVGNLLAQDGPAPVEGARWFLAGSAGDGRRSRRRRSVPGGWREPTDRLEDGRQSPGAGRSRPRRGRPLVPRRLRGRWPPISAPPLRPWRLARAN